MALATTKSTITLTGRKKKKKVTNIIMSALRGYTHQTGRRVSALPLKYTGNPNALGFPASLDYRQLDVVTPVRDQGYCGSSWAFSALGVYESLLAMETGIQYDLAEQFVLDCTSSGDCNGGYPIDALEILA